jgi:hypothetical protein
MSGRIAEPHRRSKSLASEMASDSWFRSGMVGPETRECSRAITFATSAWLSLVVLVGRYACVAADWADCCSTVCARVCYSRRHKPNACRTHLQPLAHIIAGLQGRWQEHAWCSTAQHSTAHLPGSPHHPQQTPQSSTVSPTRAHFVGYCAAASVTSTGPGRHIHTCNLFRGQQWKSDRDKLIPPVLGRASKYDAPEDQAAKSAKSKPATDDLNTSSRSSRWRYHSSSFASLWYSRRRRIWAQFA